MLKTDIQYFGSIHYVNTLMKHHKIMFDHEAAFTKRSFKNRMIIVTSQGPLMLTIPIVGGRDQKTPIRDVLIAYDIPWREQHFKAIKTNYKRSPYFEFYEISMQQLYLNQPAKLVDFLSLCMNWLQTQLKSTFEIISEHEQMIWKNEVKYIDPWLPNNYYQFQGLPKYQQVYADKIEFIPNTSILDMLFNVGGKEINKLLAPPLID